MSDQDLTTPQETSRDPVEIRQDAAITIQEALAIAAEEEFAVGKSTLQRWAKSWGDKGAASPVKSILVSTRFGTTYRLDREDFKSWVLEQKQNVRSGETFRDPSRSQETSRDPMRPREVSRDPERPSETPRDLTEPTGTMHNEIMQLKIDVEVRKQLLNQAAGEITRQRDQIESLLRENGGLQTRLLQIAAPVAESAPSPQREHTDVSDDAGSEASQ